ncbi:MAG TPA: hypothetical protein VFA18_12975 [Gemmataceae bacterium]|nr:hypothetical protein [Gemmataceae bacterium]
MRKHSLGLACVALLSVLFAPAAVRADEFYYLVMFSAQRDALEAQYAHTFATFVKATGQGPCLANYAIEAHTISWLPATLDIHLWARPECGRNVGLQETIRWALSNCERVSMWGPYRIQPCLYARAVRQCALLESGRVCYKALDSFHNTSRVSNCIHAVSDVVEGSRLRVLSPEWGDTASWYVLRRMEPCIIDVCQVYPCIATQLGLDAYPLVRRPFENPRSGLMWRTLKSLAGKQ